MQIHFGAQKGTHSPKHALALMQLLISHFLECCTRMCASLLQLQSGIAPAPLRRCNGRPKPAMKHAERQMSSSPV